jgi:pyridoxal phosphate enzyme (YggS family)
MHSSVINLIDIENKLNVLVDQKIRKPEIIAVSKTFDIEHIKPVLEYGHKNFGENKIQEAISKWTDAKKEHIDIKLHMLGKVQTNKVKFLIPLFDYLHSLDNLKLAEKISKEEVKKNKKIKIFIQVNLGEEEQKNGINLKDFDNFYYECKKNLNLDIIGLMCLPPQNENPEKFFQKLKECSDKFGLKDLSMGMSNDYDVACKFGSTFLRIGTKIFGERG